MRSSVTIVLGAGIVGCAVAVSPLAGQDDPPVDPDIQRLERLSIPVGGVILWWGLNKDIPEGFEACDGKRPTTKNATLNLRKPDLRNRFPLGAPNEFRYRPWNPNIGELPAHAHTTSHDHTLSGHTHSVGGHTHALSGHTHPLNVVVAKASVDLNGDDKVDNDDSYVQSISPGTGAKSDTATGGPSTANTGTASGNTGGPSTADTSLDNPLSSTPVPSTGSGAPAPNVEPAFTEFIFIIRVK